MEHSLRVDPKVKPWKQRFLTMSEDHKKAAQNEVQKLLDVGVIREVPRMAGQCSHGPEEEWKLLNVH